MILTGTSYSPIANQVHPISPFGNLTSLDLVLDRMEELGLYLVYEMRWYAGSPYELQTYAMLTPTGRTRTCQLLQKRYPG